MNIFDKNNNNHGFLWIGLQLLILIDIFLITIMILLNLPQDDIQFIQRFDFIICIFLLIEWSLNFHSSKSKMVFLKQKGNWLDLIASIPFDEILPIFLPQLSLLRYFRLLKLLRIIVLFNSLITSIDNFIRKTHLDKILVIIIVLIGLFTLILWSLGNLNLVDSLYFVIETITSVGYGDITPKTVNEKAITMLIIIVGVFIFSTITAVISSFFTDRLIDDEKILIQLDEVKMKFTNMKEQNEELKEDVSVLKKQNEELLSEINELKDLIKK